MRETLVQPEKIVWAARGVNPPGTMTAPNLLLPWNQSTFAPLPVVPQPDAEGWVRVSPGHDGFVALACDYGWDHTAYARIEVRGATGGEVFDNGCSMGLHGEQRKPWIWGSEPRGQFDRFIARGGDGAWQSFMLRGFRYQVGGPDRSSADVPRRGRPRPSRRRPHAHVRVQ